MIATTAVSSSKALITCVDTPINGILSLMGVAEARYIVEGLPVVKFITTVVHHDDMSGMNAAGLEQIDYYNTLDEKDKTISFGFKYAITGIIP